MMNKECNLITPENIQGELINNEIEQINLRAQVFKEQKYNELLKENKDLQTRIDKAIEYINHFSKKSEVKINGLPDCKVFIGDIEQLLEILGGKE